MKQSDIQVTLIDHMGSDLSVVNAARVSFNKESEYDLIKGPSDSTFEDSGKLALKESDAKLIRYLAKHKHFSPFNHSFITMRIKAPIFVARQLVKHRFMPWNEVSRRYVEEDVELYFPEYWRKKADNVKQGSSDEKVNPVFERGHCGYCGSQFLSKSPNQKYCSVNCQANHYRERHPFETKWTRWKASAKSRGLEFTINEDSLEWPRYCPYLGCELNYQSDDKADNVASLDRIDSSKGYIEGNVQIISSLANKMKNDANRDNLIEFARSVLAIHAGILVPNESGISQSYEQSLIMYNNLLAQGVCPEQARMFLPQGVMTEWIWSGTLGAWCDMLRLRLDPHTQYESRIVAQKAREIIEPLFPVSVKALLND